MSLSIEQMQANADAKYHLDRLIAFAQCSKLSATNQQIKECLLSIFDHNVTEINTSFSQDLNNYGCSGNEKNANLHSVRIENKRNWFGGYTTEIEVV